MKKIFVVLFFVLSSLFIVTPVHAADIITGEKLITVDIGKQMLYA